MKRWSILLWQCTVAILWLLSLLAVIDAGFKPGMIPQPASSYPWFGVIVMSTVITIECAVLYLLLRPQRHAWSSSRLGMVFGVFCVLSIGAAYTFFIYDLPAFVYVPSGVTLVLTLFLLLLLAFSVSISLVKWFFKKKALEM